MDYILPIFGFISLAIGLMLDYRYVTAENAWKMILNKNPMYATKFLPSRVRMAVHPNYYLLWSVSHWRAWIGRRVEEDQQEQMFVQKLNELRDSLIEFAVATTRSGDMIGAKLHDLYEQNPQSLKDNNTRGKTE